jgi:glycosyltransferase involved in cell wall biosynthesis
MHVLFVTGEYPPMQGGVGAYTRALACALHDLGVRITVLTSQRAAQPNCAEFDGCIRVLPAIQRWDWQIFQTVPALAAELGADWVHVQYQTAAFDMHPAINFAPWQWRRREIRTAWTYHDLLPMYLFPKAGRRLRAWVTERPAHFAERIIATTEADRQCLSKHGIDAANIPIGSNIVSQSLTPEQRRLRRQQRGYSDDDFVLAYFGFLNQSKGVVELLKALHQLSQSRPTTRLLMIGERVGASDATNNAYAQKVEAAIHKHHLEARVQWTGDEPDAEVAADLNACDVLVLPFLDGASLRRGTLMAGLANGCAIVTTTPQSPLSELEDGRDLLFAPAGDIAALAAAVQRIANDPALATMLRDHARARSHLFTWPEIARAHLMLYG